MSKKKTLSTLPALKVRQWLADWDEIEWSKEDRGAEPQHWFYQFSMKAQDLKALSGIYPRTVKRKKGSEDLGIQRRHETSRSTEIRRFVKYGYPWSELSDAKRKSGEFHDLRQPGWLPTAIVVNIRTADAQWLGKKLDKRDLVEIVDNNDGFAEVRLPKEFSGSNWRHNSIPPVEVIDGQHRLWAFEDEDLNGDFELPVVAFVGLDRRWQAYLFYTINIKPKRINASLAFDLYPLLRTQEWLTKFEGHVIYRETRAQELVDLLWSHENSPWYHRINMLGEKGHKGRMVTQAAWVRSLLASFVKSWEGPGVKIGGLFGSTVGEHEAVLSWSRTEQAAFLIVAGERVRLSVLESEQGWAKALRGDQVLDSANDEDPAFYGSSSLLNQDQGIRILLQIINDLVFVRSDDLNLHDWGGSQERGDSDDDQISMHVDSLVSRVDVIDYLDRLAALLSGYDWRSSDAPGLEEGERLLKASFRGSGGYKELRQHVLSYLSKEGGPIGGAAEDVMLRLGYR